MSCRGELTKRIHAYLAKRKQGGDRSKDKRLLDALLALKSPCPNAGRESIIITESLLYSRVLDQLVLALLCIPSLEHVV